MSINVPAIIAARIEQFTGRTWLLPKVLDWYERSQDRSWPRTWQVISSWVGRETGYRR